MSAERPQRWDKLYTFGGKPVTVVDVIGDVTYFVYGHDAIGTTRNPLYESGNVNM